MEEVKKTAGQIITEFNEKDVSPITPQELVKEGSHKKYDSNLDLIIKHHVPLYKRDFYIERRTQHEWPLGGVPHTVTKARSTCPTPDYLQTVIKYHYKEEAIEYLWTLPARWQIPKYKKNPLLLTPAEQKTLKHILDFQDRTLFRLSKKLNNEPENVVYKSPSYAALFNKAFNNKNLIQNIN